MPESRIPGVTAWWTVPREWNSSDFSGVWWP